MVSIFSILLNVVLIWFNVVLIWLYMAFNMVLRGMIMGNIASGLSFLELHGVTTPW